MKALLLYDMKETALAKDVRDLVLALGVKLELIPLHPNNTSSTLGGKEAQHFEKCEAVLFLVTPRDEAGTISGSVIHELGQATQKFAQAPDKVMVLAEDTCVFPVIEQRPRNIFNRRDGASVVRAVTVLIEELRKANLLAEASDPKAEEEKFGLKQAARLTGLVEAVVFISEGKDLVVDEDELDQFFMAKLRLTQQQVNFVKSELQHRRLADKGYGSYGHREYYWQLSRQGVELASQAVSAGAARAEVSKT